MQIKRTWLLTLLIGLVIAGAASYWGYDQYQEKEQIEVYLGNKYQQAFYSLVDNVEQVQVLLGKSLVSTSPRKNILILTDIWNKAQTAQADLNQLPLSAQTVVQTTKFLSQTGDYCNVLARNNAEGKVLTAKQRETLRELREHAAEISESLHNLESQVFAGNINWAELVRGARRQLAKDGEKGSDPIEDGFSDITQELTKYPTLIYDGPFSDHIEEESPKGLTGSEISREEAEKKAKEVVDFEEGVDAEISGGTSVNGRIPSFNFDISSEGKGKYSVDISKKGGHLVSMLNNRDVNSPKIQLKEAVEKASDFLATRGYPNMESTYSEVNENIGFISFAYKRGDITFYPDVINVQVALDNGQVMAVSALTYLMSHRKRDVEKPSLSPDEAKEMAASTLEEIENVKLALIPKADLSEVLTYEVRGSVGGETYLIYINALNGDEEQIFRVVKGQDGTFVL